MDLEKIIKGINPIKQKPIERIPFEKDKPIWAHNFPMSKFLYYFVSGFKRQGPAGMMRPFKVKKKVATGTEITAELFGLDRITSIDMVKQIF